MPQYVYLNPLNLLEKSYGSLSAKILKLVDVHSLRVNKGMRELNGIKYIRSFNNNS